MPRSRAGRREHRDHHRSVQSDRRRRHAQPTADFRVLSQGATDTPRAPGRSYDAGPPGVSRHRVRRGNRYADGFLSAGPQGRETSKPASSTRSRGYWSRPGSCSAPKKSRRTSRPAPSIASAMWSWRRVCRSSCGAAFPTTSCWMSATKDRLRDPKELERQVRRMLADPKSDALISEFCRAVAVPARSGERADRGDELRRQPAPGVPARNGDVLRRLRRGGCPKSISVSRRNASRRLSLKFLASVCTPSSSRRYSHCPAKLLISASDLGSASIRRTCRSSSFGSRSRFLTAASSSSSSGMLLQRRNDSRDARSTSLMR